MSTLTIKDIENRIPHRFENLLLDQCDVNGDDQSKFNVSLNKGDSYGRDLFIYDYEGTPSIPTPLLSEISALACIVSAGEIKPGTFAYFAAIANFSIESTPFKAAEDIHGTTQKISGKNGFYKYRFEISTKSNRATGQLMAYYDTSGNSDVTLKPIEFPDAIHSAIRNGSPVTPFEHKQHNMTFIDTVHLVNTNEALYGYQYPLSHPLIKGHFPNNPVMMGVCQWQMLEDAMSHYFAQFNGPTVVEKTCNAVIVKSNLTPVCELKSATLIGKNTNGQWHVHTKSIKKVLFKQRVEPNDQLYLIVTAIA